MKKILTFTISFLMCLISTFAFACSPLPKDKVTIKYYAEASNIRLPMLSGNETIGLVPEPLATGIEKAAQNEGKTFYRLNLQELYDQQEKGYPQAVLMVKKSVVGSHPEIVQLIENKIAESVNWVKSNPSLAVDTISELYATTLQAGALSQSAIDGCNIYFQNASEAKNLVTKYINDIIDIDDKKASAVNDDFFYTQSSLQSNANSYSFVMPDGAPALSVSKMICDKDDLGTGKQIVYDVVAGEMIKNKFITGGADFIIAPVNLASNLYKTHNQTDHYVMVGVVTHGNFYIISDKEITVNDLVGKRVAVPMPNAVPDWTFKMVLNKFNLLYTVIE